MVQEDIYTRQGGGGKVQSEAARLLVDPSSAPLELAASAAAAESMSSEPSGSSGLASSSWPPSRHICTASCGAGARASSSPDSSPRHICREANARSCLDDDALSVYIYHESSSGAGVGTFWADQSQPSFMLTGLLLCKKHKHQVMQGLPTTATCMCAIAS